MAACLFHHPQVVRLLHLLPVVPGPPPLLQPSLGSVPPPLSKEGWHLPRGGLWLLKIICRCPPPLHIACISSFPSPSSLSKTLSSGARPPMFHSSQPFSLIFTKIKFILSVLCNGTSIDTFCVEIWGRHWLAERRHRYPFSLFRESDMTVATGLHIVTTRCGCSLQSPALSLFLLSLLLLQNGRFHWSPHQLLVFYLLKIFKFPPITFAKLLPQGGHNVDDDHVAGVVGHQAEDKDPVGFEEIQDEAIQKVWSERDHRITPLHHGTLNSWLLFGREEEEHLGELELLLPLAILSNLHELQDVVHFLGGDQRIHQPADGRKPGNTRRITLQGEGRRTW